MLDATLKKRVEIGDEQGGFGKVSKTFEVQSRWNQSRAKNVELEGLSVTIRSLGRGEKKKRWISNPRLSGGGDAEWRRRRRSAWLGVGRVWLYQNG